MAMLLAELAKSEYSALTHAECFAAVRALSEPTVGSIRGVQLKFLQVFISSTNLRARLAAATGAQVPVAAALSEAIHPAYLAAEATFSINLSDPDVLGMLAGAIATGLLTSAESATLVAMATYNLPLFPDATLLDIVTARDPAAVAVGGGTDIGVVPPGQLILRLQEALPEPSVVRIEVCLSPDGVEFSNWRTAGHIFDVHHSDMYFYLLPVFPGLVTRVRWRGEFYRAVGTLSGV